MTNLLTDKERERLAIDFVGWIKQKQSTIGEEMCYWQKLGELGPSHRCQVTNWLSGNLTSPESYYQVHHILLPKVFEDETLAAAFAVALRKMIFFHDLPTVGIRRVLAILSASNETICRALLDMLEESDGVYE